MANAFFFCDRNILPRLSIKSTNYGTKVAITSPEPDPDNDTATTLPAPHLENESDHNMVKPWTPPSPRAVAMNDLENRNHTQITEEDTEVVHVGQEVLL